MPSSSANALMPGPSRLYVGQSVPTIDAHSSNERLSPSGGRRSTSRKLYSTAPDCHSFSVCATWKTKLKSLPNDDAQGKLQPIRRLYSCSFASGARDTAQSVTSWLARWTTEPSNPSAIAEQDGHPAV